MIYGYARVSSKGQNEKLQVEALKKAGCDKIIAEKASVIEKRPKLDKLLHNLKEGDTLIVWKLDRLGREMFSLFNLIQELADKHVEFKAIEEDIDTTTSIGKLMIALSAYFAEMERNLIKERTKAGRKYANKGGRPKGLSKRSLEVAPTLIKMYQEVDNEKFTYSISEILKATGVNKRTFYNILEYYKIEKGHRYFQKSSKKQELLPIIQNIKN